MNKLSTYKLVIALLIALNLTTVGTILVNQYKVRQEKESILIDPESNVRINGRYFRHELGFDNHQMQEFRTVNRAFQPAARNLLMQIDSLKNESFVELNLATPDTVKLNRIASEIGNRHGQLKHSTHRYYMQVRTICTPEQAGKLQEVFVPLFRAAPCGATRNKKMKFN